MCTHLFCFHKRIAAALEVLVKIDSSELTSSLSLTVTLTEAYAAHSTGEIVVVNGLKFSFSPWLNSIHKADSSWVLMVVWIIRHAKVVGMSPKASSTPSCIHQLRSILLAFGQLVFHHLMYTTHSSLDQGDSSPFCPWSLLGLGTPSSSIPPSQHLNVGPRVFVLHYVWMYFYLCGLCV